MKYSGEQALGLIETVGMVPALEATDKMLKAANVALVAYENIGSTLVTIMVRGDVAGVAAAVEAGVTAAAAIGKVTAKNVIAAPIEAVGNIVSVHQIDQQSIKEEKTKERYEALGLIEVFGLVFILEAVDAMGKAADVQLIGYENVASGYISALVQGDMGACQTAVAAGVHAVQTMGTEVHSATVIARPHPDLQKIIERYALDKLF